MLCSSKTCEIHCPCLLPIYEAFNLISDELLQSYACKRSIWCKSYLRTSFFFLQVMLFFGHLLTGVHDVVKNFISHFVEES